MSQDRRTSRKSYSEAMNEWASNREKGRTLLAAPAFSIFAPDPFAHPVAKFFGWLWRVGLLAVLAGAVYYFLLQRHLASKEFGAKIAEEVKVYLGAEQTEGSALNWRGDRASIRSLRAIGGSGTIFRTLEAENVTFRVPFSMLWKKDWTPARVEMGRLEAALRSVGGSDAAGAAAAAPPLSGATPDDLPVDGVSTKIKASLTNDLEEEEKKQPTGKGVDLRLRQDGFGVEPSFGRVALEGVTCDDATLTWGSSIVTRGTLSHVEVDATRSGNEWTLVLSPKGTLEQNWLRPLQLGGGRLRVDAKQLHFDELKFRLGETGQGSLTGAVALGEVPRLDLTMKAERLPLGQLVGEEFEPFISAQATGTLKIGGSTNQSSGVSTIGTLALEQGIIRTLPVFDTLAVVTGRVRFRQFAFSKGEMTMETGGGRLAVKSFAFQSEEDIVAQGSFVWERGFFRGEMKLGADPALLGKLPPELLAEWFATESAGKRWITIPLEGSLRELTEAQSLAMAQAYQKAKK